MNTVELQQMRGHGGIALEFVDMHDLEAIARAEIVVRSRHAAESCVAQGKPPMRPMPLMPTRIAAS